MKRYFLTILLIVLLSGCATQQGYQGRKGQIGVAVGSGAGALIGQAIGHNTEATLIGAGFGALFGYVIGNEIDKYDTMMMGKVFDQSPSNITREWRNPDSGNMYSMTPQPAYISQSGMICREAELSAIVDGRSETIKTLACRDNNGTWTLQR